MIKPNSFKLFYVIPTREQCDREAALEEFKNSSVRILVATDVASRGLDVKDITLVIFFLIRVIVFFNSVVKIFLIGHLFKLVNIYLNFTAICYYCQ